MAEAVGLVASVITLSEVATKISVLRDLWKQFQDVPHDIQYQLDQLEALDAVMTKVELQAESNSSLGTSTGVLAVKHCKQAALELDKSIQELERRIHSAGPLRRALGKAKVVLEKESISRAQRRLQEALQIMQLAITLHICSLTESVPERTAAVFFARQTESKAPASSGQTTPKLTNGKKQEASSTILQAKRPLPWLYQSAFGRIMVSRHAVIQQDANFDTDSQQIAQARIILPSWLSSKIWDVFAHRSVHGLMWKLSSWNVRPWSSPIFDAVSAGSISNLMEMLSSGRGSLYDRTPCGQTLLHIAAYNGRFDMAKSLIKMGIPMLEQAIFGLLPFQLAFFRHRPHRTYGEPLDLFISAINVGEFRQDWALLYGQIPRAESTHSIFSQSLWSVPGLITHIDSEMTTKFRELPTRLKLAHLRWQLVEVSVLNNIMTENNITFDDLRLNMNNTVDSSLHEFVFAYFAHFCQMALAYPKPDEGFFISKHQEWNQLAYCVLSDMPLSFLTNLSVSGMTPLLYGAMFQLETLFCYKHRLPSNKRRKTLKLHLDMVRAFLDVVSRSGIDLQEYGRDEVAAFQSHKRVFSNKGRTFFMHSLYYWQPYLVSISYGPTPEDWTFLWDDLVEEFAGEFWQMIEDGYYKIEDGCSKIPGAWVD
ncbi:ankyrin repeats (many copies) domain-containing protein [Pochonia chlamydosporia 170]|uniref:Ankyrin repeats (Many copies) domain-containing protein n=1 Tax=Pochonia chlamydosporia 170 TaxID=1380566 RepID=A0A179FNB3_METCM|nr:ankyrin repeats (many copies) domain-containing protein [Pochonia chlamydosporia 170]OAQ66837.1 ankyrin repeats (many copies) domain-containing protein [Pochonia chlamydosporia 170]